MTPGKKISIFITAGYPSIESTMDQLLFLQEKKIDFVEVGIPFSDPMADGPMIQYTSSIALKNGMNLKLLFDLIEEKREVIKIPLVLMGYFNPIFQFGIEQFLTKCQQLQINQLIIPDISLEIYEEKYKDLFNQYGVSLCFLVTPETDDKRIRRMVQLTKNGFIYLISQNSITGENKLIDPNVLIRYGEIKELCKNVPLMIGFGIQDKASVEQVTAYSDGAIIGTAYLKALQEQKEAEFIDSVVN